MRHITYIKGDARKPIGRDMKVIVHVCNDIGRWGKGFVVALSKKWHQPEVMYKKWYKENIGFSLGAVQFVQVEDDLYVANMIGQHTIWNDKDGNPPVRYDAIRTGLQCICQWCIDNDASVHAPKFGAGLAGGDWNIIEDMIKEELLKKNINVFIYELK